MGCPAGAWSSEAPAFFTMSFKEKAFEVTVGVRDGTSESKSYESDPKEAAGGGHRKLLGTRSY